MTWVGQTLVHVRLADIPGVTIGTLAGEAPTLLDAGPLVQARCCCTLRNISLAEVALETWLAGAGEGGDVVVADPPVLARGGGTEVNLGAGSGGVS